MARRPSSPFRVGDVIDSVNGLSATDVEDGDLVRFLRESAYEARSVVVVRREPSEATGDAAVSYSSDDGIVDYDDAAVAAHGGGSTVGSSLRRAAASVSVEAGAAAPVVAVSSTSDALTTSGQSMDVAAIVEEIESRRRRQQQQQQQPPQSSLQRALRQRQQLETAVIIEDEGRTLERERRRGVGGDVIEDDEHSIPSIQVEVEEEEDEKDATSNERRDAVDAASSKANERRLRRERKMDRRIRMDRRREKRKGRRKSVTDVSGQQAQQARRQQQQQLEQSPRIGAPDATNVSQAVIGGSPGGEEHQQTPRTTEGAAPTHSQEPQQLQMDRQLQADVTSLLTSSSPSMIESLGRTLTHDGITPEERQRLGEVWMEMRTRSRPDRTLEGESHQQQTHQSFGAVAGPLERQQLRMDRQLQADVTSLLVFSSPSMIESLGRTLTHDGITPEERQRLGEVWMEMRRMSGPQVRTTQQLSGVGSSDATNVSPAIIEGAPTAVGMSPDGESQQQLAQSSEGSAGDLQEAQQLQMDRQLQADVTSLLVFSSPSMIESLGRTLTDDGITPEERQRLGEVWMEFRKISGPKIRTEEGDSRQQQTEQSSGVGASDSTGDSPAVVEVAPTTVGMSPDGERRQQLAPSSEGLAGDSQEAQQLQMDRQLQADVTSLLMFSSPSMIESLGRTLTEDGITPEERQRLGEVWMEFRKISGIKIRSEEGDSQQQTQLSSDVGSSDATGVSSPVIEGAPTAIDMSPDGESWQQLAPSSEGSAGDSQEAQQLQMDRQLQADVTSLLMFSSPSMMESLGRTLTDDGITPEERQRLGEVWMEFRKMSGPKIRTEEGDRQQQQTERSSGVGSSDAMDASKAPIEGVPTAVGMSPDEESRQQFAPSSEVSATDSQEAQQLQMDRQLQADVTSLLMSSSPSMIESLGRTLTDDGITPEERQRLGEVWIEMRTRSRPDRTLEGESHQQQTHPSFGAVAGPRGSTRDAKEVAKVGALTAQPSSYDGIDDSQPLDSASTDEPSVRVVSAASSFDINAPAAHERASATSVPSDHITTIQEPEPLAQDMAEESAYSDFLDFLLSPSPPGSSESDPESQGSSSESPFQNLQSSEGEATVGESPQISPPPTPLSSQDEASRTSGTGEPTLSPSTASLSTAEKTQDTELFAVAELLKVSPTRDERSGGRILPSPTNPPPSPQKALSKQLTPLVGNLSSAVSSRPGQPTTMATEEESKEHGINDAEMVGSSSSTELASSFTLARVGNLLPTPMETTAADTIGELESSFTLARVGNFPLSPMDTSDLDADALSNTLVRTDYAVVAMPAASITEMTPSSSPRTDHEENTRSDDTPILEATAASEPNIAAGAAPVAASPLSTQLASSSHLARVGHFPPSPMNEGDSDADALWYTPVRSDYATLAMAAASATEIELSSSQQTDDTHHAISQDTSILEAQAASTPNTVAGTAPLAASPFSTDLSSSFTLARVGNFPLSPTEAGDSDADVNQNTIASADDANETLIDASTTETSSPSSEQTEEMHNASNQGMASPAAAISQTHDNNDESSSSPQTQTSGDSNSKKLRLISTAPSIDSEEATQVRSPENERLEQEIVDRWVAVATDESLQANAGGIADASGIGVVIATPAGNVEHDSEAEISPRTVANGIFEVEDGTTMLSHTTDEEILVSELAGRNVQLRVASPEREAEKEEEVDSADDDTTSRRSEQDILERWFAGEGPADDQELATTQDILDRWFAGDGPTDDQELMTDRLEITKLDQEGELATVQLGANDDGSVTATDPSLLPVGTVMPSEIADDILKKTEEGSAAERLAAPSILPSQTEMSSAQRTVELGRDETPVEHEVNEEETPNQNQQRQRKKVYATALLYLLIIVGVILVGTILSPGAGAGNELNDQDGVPFATSPPSKAVSFSTKPTVSACTFPASLNTGHLS